ncbi:ATP-binding cassette domain-containing protein [Pseudidiomarina halophila]|uniref:ABC transporter ATP-binding protein n=1 Tax=Pseudidiomarina halophila TaxID=1449799 RepID=A0A432Y0R7_9GAMM|nr:ATP-binding cassette domain-containing protein [Pseudidiomarina halophila]RUO54538.1 ABC transporter ATP-binding protein [Pseudidiomarina halophila]
MSSESPEICFREQLLHWQESGTTLALPDIILAKGQSAGVMGPSGCGKSSWLRCLLGEAVGHVKLTGEFYVRDREISKLAIEDRNIGILLQDNPLFPHYSVRKNLAFALQKKNVSRAEQNQMIASQLALLGMADFIDRLPGQLSGGQRARIGLLRTVLAEPALVLLDEPFNALDSQRRQQVRDWTFAFLKQRGISSIIVSHQADDLTYVDQHVSWPEGVSE